MENISKYIWQLLVCFVHGEPFATSHRFGSVIFAISKHVGLMAGASGSETAPLLAIPAALSGANEAIRHLFKTV